MPDQNGVVLSTVIIKTCQMETLSTFYGQGLGLGHAEPTGDNHLGFTLSNLYFGFDQVENSPEPSGAVSIWFDVNDIQATFERFEAIGAGIEYAPTRKPWGGYLAALYDPDGNLFGLSQIE
jgi:predicted enzyme related to lactoylglutathione lyase